MEGYYEPNLDDGTGKRDQQAWNIDGNVDCVREILDPQQGLMRYPAMNLSA